MSVDSPEFTMAQALFQWYGGDPSRLEKLTDAEVGLLIEYSALMERRSSEDFAALRMGIV